MAQALVLLRNSALILFYCFINTFLVEIRLDVSPKNVATSCPNRDSLSALMNNEVAKMLVIIR